MNDLFDVRRKPETTMWFMTYNFEWNWFYSLYSRVRHYWWKRDEYKNHFITSAGIKKMMMLKQYKGSEMVEQTLLRINFRHKILHKTASTNNRLNLSSCTIKEIDLCYFDYHFNNSCGAAHYYKVVCSRTKGLVGRFYLLNKTHISEPQLFVGVFSEIKDKVRL